jgi:hypothetical protein
MGYPVQESDLEHLSPILSGHINLHGSHHFDLHVFSLCQEPFCPSCLIPSWEVEYKVDQLCYQ